MSGNRSGANDNFSSDEAAPPSKQYLEPTRTGASYFGLEELDEDGDLAFHAIVTNLFQIGRDPNCNLTIKGDTKTSRYHATIKRESEVLVLEDNASSNGTQVNGKKITAPHELKLGDEIQIGKRAFKFTQSG